MSLSEIVGIFLEVRKYCERRRGGCPAILRRPVLLAARTAVCAQRPEHHPRLGVMLARVLMTARGPGGHHNGHSLVPVRKALTGPNQRWDWDIAYPSTREKGAYLDL